MATKKNSASASKEKIKSTSKKSKGTVKKAPATPKAERKPTQERALIAKCQKIKRLELAATSDECNGRYAIGVEILSVRTDKKTYGTGAVEKIAAALGRDANTLYDYGKVAEVWDEPKFETQSKKPNKNGVPLSFSHFIVLANVKDAAGRARFLEAALAEALSVSALKEKSNPKKEEKPVAVFKHVVESLTTRIKTWSEKLETNLNGASDKDIATLAETCDGAAETLHTFANTLRDQGGQNGAPAGGPTGPVSTSPKDAEVNAAE